MLHPHGPSQSAVERLRRPSMRIDLANPDPELFGPAREAAEEGGRLVNSVTAHFPRVALRDYGAAGFFEAGRALWCLGTRFACFRQANRLWSPLLSRSHHAWI